MIQSTPLTKNIIKGLIFSPIHVICGIFSPTYTGACSGRDFLYQTCENSATYAGPPPHVPLLLSSVLRQFQEPPSLPLSWLCLPGMSLWKGHKKKFGMKVLVALSNLLNYKHHHPCSNFAREILHILSYIPTISKSSIRKKIHVT